ncbi:TetR/AcrR family transcriptional regulator [Nocardioides sp.]|uniref:TetR/AcrR family transcriptional regulator n=1 Tax=Nocardioides sp. TaxID=35761 RepID=UPI0035136B5C
MARLTRKETQELTRARLIDTAKVLFLAEGYNATSLGQVADAAGYTKGAVYSNFADKQELGLAVLDVVLTERVEALLTEIAPAESDEQVLAAFTRWAEQHIGDVGWTALEVEFAISTRHQEDVRLRLAERRRGITLLLAELLRDRSEALGLALDGTPEDVATHLLALGIGLGVQRAFDPDLPIDVLVDHLAQLSGGGAPSGARVS